MVWQHPSQGVSAYYSCPQRDRSADVVRATRQAGLRRLFRAGIASFSHTAGQFHTIEHNILCLQTADTSGKAKNFFKIHLPPVKLQKLRFSMHSIHSVPPLSFTFIQVIQLHSNCQTPHSQAPRCMCPMSLARTHARVQTQGKMGTNYHILTASLELFFTGSGKLPLMGL